MFCIAIVSAVVAAGQAVSAAFGRRAEDWSSASFGAAVGKPGVSVAFGSRRWPAVITTRSCRRRNGGPVPGSLVAARHSSGVIRQGFVLRVSVCSSVTEV